jgi:ribonuclease D
MSVRPLRSLSELTDDYERVILLDGTQMLRERQTKAQAKIQALRVKIRNEKLRKNLILLSGEVSKSAEFKKPGEIAQQGQTEVNHQLKENQNKLPLNNNPSPDNSIDTDGANVKEISAIQKQMINNSETETKTKTESHEASNTNTNTKYQPKSAKFHALNLRKLIFGQPVNK